MDIQYNNDSRKFSNICLPSGPVYTMLFSYKDGMEMFRFGLPSTLYRFPLRHQMKTVA